MENFGASVALSLCLLSLVGARDLKVTYHIDEELSNGTFIGNVAIDSQIRTNLSSELSNGLQFSFLKQGRAHSDMFNLSRTTGDMTIASRVDREYLCHSVSPCVISLVIAAMSVNDFVETIKVQLFISDRNDNHPFFEQAVIAREIPETANIGSSIPIISATDIDIGENSVQNYDLVPHDGAFGLRVVKNVDKTFGLRIIIRQALNRETKDFYQVTVIAKDGGTPQETGSMTVNITIVDANDNAPKFSESIYNVTIDDTTNLNAPFLTVFAYDSDLDLNGEISYAFSSRVSQKLRNFFTINVKSGEISLTKSITYDLGNLIEIVVEARDHGDPWLSSQAVVLINVLDTSNAPPLVTVSFLSSISGNIGQVSEAATKGSFVAHVAVSDINTGNGMIYCDCKNSNFSLVKLSKYEYKVVTGVDLDRETVSQYNITITCHDDSSPPQETTVDIVLEVKDENDNAPVFTKTSYMVKMLENNERYQEIVQVSAKDKDSGANGHVSYKLHPDDAGSLFIINEETGLIKANTILDREQSPIIRFRVLARDGGELPKVATCTVTLSLVDVNDEAPRFAAHSLTMSVVEHQKPDVIVGRIIVTDADLGIGGEVTLSMVTTNMAFLLSADGTIRASKSLDREMRPSYEIVVVATDHGRPPLSSSATVTIFVLDQNDHSPVITFPNKINDTIELPIDQSPNYPFATIKASDKDHGQNGQISFSIINGNDEKLFSLDKISGNIQLTRYIKIEDKMFYSLRIAAQDEGEQPRVALTTLFVKLTTMRNKTVVTYFSNTTAVDDGQGDHNMVIVIVLAAVTTILSIVIVATICIIKKVDQRKTEKKMKAGNFHDMVTANNSELVLNASKLNMQKPPSETDSLDLKHKKTKKEVSFSLEETDGKATTASMERSLNLINLGVSSPRKIQSYLSSISDQKVLEGKHFADTNKKSEDNHSESSGETTTSDSGHGGSDEDINSQRQYTAVDASMQSTTKMAYPTNPEYNGYPGYPMQEVPVKPQRVNLQPKSYNTNYLLQEEDSRSSPYQTQEDISYTDSIVQLKHLAQQNMNYDGFYNSNSNTPRFDQHYPSPRAQSYDADCFGDSTFENDNRQRYQCTNNGGLNNYGVCREDDDDNTTTSGSYMVDPVDLHNLTDERISGNIIV